MSFEDDFKKTEFKKLLKEKEVQIILRTQGGIQESENFKKLQNLFVSYKNKRPVRDFTAILIPKDELVNLVEDSIPNLYNSLDSHEGITNNHIVVNRNLLIHSCERKSITENNDARRLYSELSHEFCVFLISPEGVGVPYFIDGHDFGEAIFFTPAAFNSYINLRDISKIIEIFDEYRLHVSVRDTYQKFFVSESAKRSLFKHLSLANQIKGVKEEDFLEDQRHLLENKPEDRFREDLRYYLRQKLKVTFLSKEEILNNFKRLDIFITDELGELYLIEVKWVGESIHATGEKLGTSYSEKDINPAAVNQSVGYIKELYSNRSNIKTAFLVVFDARKESLPDTLHNYDTTQLSKDDEIFYYRFKKVPDVRVINAHPN